VGVPIAAIAIERSLRGIEADVVAAAGLRGRVALVSDPDTHAALGERGVRALAGRVSLVPLRLPAHPHADLATVEAVRAASASCDALLAVGSGTINDLCKYAAALDGKPHAVFATAPSMNGYTSVNAAITVDGHKRSLPAQAPRGVFVDLEVMAKAPARLIRAGIGDSICRPTAQSDWLLSHFVHCTPYRRAPFVLLAEDEAGWLDAANAVVAGDLEAMSALARTLVLSGLGMTVCGGSYPASQGEHLISHYLDMFAPAPALHGEQVAVATLAMARLQEKLLDGAAPALRDTAATEPALVERFGPDLGRSCWREFAAKALSREGAALLTERLRARWHEIRTAIHAVALPASRIAGALRLAGVPTTPAEIGIDEALFGRALREARFLRDRYTFLDLAGDAGRL